MNSRYLTPDHLLQLMEALSFVEVRNRWKEGGKMAYWLFKKKSIPKPNIDATPFRKKAVLRTGNRNNFSILL